MDGFKTCADVAKAEQEGALVVYSTDPEAAAEQELAKFHALFPKIKPTYLRLQAGALYAKLMAERQGNAYLADIAQLSDMSFALDFQKRGGYMQYRVAGNGRLQAGIQKLARGLLDLGRAGHRGDRVQSEAGVGRGCTEDLEGHAGSEMDRRDLGQGVDFRTAARGVVRAAPALRQRLLATARRR